MALAFYNTFTKKKEIFVPLFPGKVGIYNCGPTVYHYAHIGNMRAYLAVDILRRALEWNDYEVKHIMNITDVGHLVSDGDEGEDKMEKGARLAGKTAQEIAKFFSAEFFKDLERLNMEKADVYPKATDHINEQIALIEKLEAKGFTYRTNDGVYFDTAKFPSYGEFAGLNIEGQKEGARVETNKEKRNATDFALWKFSRPEEKRQQEWSSPWGLGFPGWHIECSAMAMKYLGETFDIHAGGADLISVHHTNEIAQSECATEKPFARFWLHSGFINVEGQKMSKSLGNVFRVQDIIDRGISPLAYRYWLLTAHYSKTVNFTWKTLEGAQIALTKLHELFQSLKDGDSTPDAKYLARFAGVLDDDLNTPKAVALLWELVKDVEIKNKKATILEFDKILGLGFSLSKEKLASLRGNTHENISAADAPILIKNLLLEREIARKNKNWQKSDELRDEIARMGYKITDTDNGAIITYQSSAISST
jgi:cysteinyl-tRNA synthetase